MLRTEELSRIFIANEVQTVALSRVNIAIEKGEFVAVMGPSGCGKTTLLNILGLLDRPTSGRYWLEGKEVSGLSELQRTFLRKGKISFIFQSFNLIDELSVYQNIELPLLYMGLSSRERKNRVKAVLESMKLIHRRRNYPRQLSGGQQQLVAIARAVVTRPDIIFADEPTGNLDSVNGSEIMDNLTKLNNDGTTVVMVTHSPTQADKTHRIIQLFDGHVVSENVRKTMKTG
ncbi:MAG: ABC transporter ATP-binding protein [Bacteroidales bacterium]|nr:ABC transporter ATP-binding protein [Bacteroidales bacterium]